MEQPPLVSSLQFFFNFSDKSVKNPHHSSLPGFLEFHLRASHSSLRLAVLAVSVLMLPCRLSRHQCHSKLGFRLGISTPCKNPPPTLALRYHLFSGPHDGLSENRFHLVDTASARGIHPEEVPNSVGYLLSEVRIGCQTLPVDGGVRCRIAPTIT